MPSGILGGRRAAACVAMAAMAAGLAGCHRGGEKLSPVADFGDRQCTGAAVTAGGRIFVCFPRWSHDTGPAVVEVLGDGSTRPYPDEPWNRWGEGDDPHAHFICVQSVWCDARDPAGALWILDAASPRFEGVVPNGAKLVQVDLATGGVTRVIRFDADIVPPGGYLNDVRVDARPRLCVPHRLGAGRPARREPR